MNYFLYKLLPDFAQYTRAIDNDDPDDTDAERPACSSDDDGMGGNWESAV